MPCPICSSCAQPLPAEARFCPSCGTPSGLSPAPRPGGSATVAPTLAPAATSPATATPSTPAPVYPPASPPAGEERKLVTVIFCDLVGSTALSGALDPETLRGVTLRYFELMHRQIESHGGTLEKFIGDAVMAVFGVPVVREDDARRALAAALAMLESLEDLNTELDAALGVRLAVRIGVNTGRVVAGSDASTRQALISGETVNVAARLEQHAGAGQILIGPQTLRAAGAAAVVEEVGPLRLKGKAEPVTAYRLLGLGADDPELLRRFDLPFVGRGRELAALDAVLARAVGEQGAQLLTVGGEAGIGKTRLVRQWLEHGGGRSTRHGAGRCRAYGDHATLAPLADAVRALLPTPPTATAPETAEALALLTTETAEALALLTTGLLHDGAPNPSLDDTCVALLTVLRQLATTERPVVLVVDDCQWAGALLLDVLDRLVGSLGQAPVLVLCLTRPDRPAVRPGRRTLPLLGLSPDESLMLAAQLTELSAHGADPCHGAVPARLLDRAGGNPLHLEQLLATLAEAAEAAEAGSPGPAAEELPTTVQALLGARIDALGRAERTTLDLAAVVGREFTAGELAELARTGPEGGPGGALAGQRDRVPTALAALNRRRLIEPGRLIEPDRPAEHSHPTGAGHPATGHPVGPGRPTEHSRSGRARAPFRFSSGLVQEVAYEGMSKRARSERHERAAELPGVRASGDGTVGGHLERAHRYRVELGLLDRHTEDLRIAAAHALGRAGAQALARADLPWATDLLARAAALHRPGEPAAAGVLRRLGEVRIALGRAAEGRALLRQVITTAAEADGTADPVDTAHAHLTLAALGPEPTEPAEPTTPTPPATDSEPDEPARTARAVLPVFEAAGDDTGQARACLRLAQQHQLAGRHGEADRLLTRALAHAVRADAEPERAAALGAVAVSLWRGPEPVTAATARCRALLAEHGTGRRAVRATLNCPLAVLLALQDRPREAEARLADAGRLAEQLGYAEALVFMPVFGATVAALADRPEHALDLLDRAAEAGHRLGGLGGLAGGLLTGITLDASRLLLDTGRPERAAHRLAVLGGAPALSPADAIDLDGLRARVAAARGEAAPALHHAERAVRAASRTDSPLLRATAALDRAHALLLLGRSAEAATEAAVARAGFAAKGHLPGVRRAERLAPADANGEDATR
ncbi:adenylate/guanylate cyclase domain-containing protein [Kitasatospora sp. NPDC004240]